MDKHSISKNLIYLRQLKGLTQERLSEKGTVTVRTIQRIEKEQVSPQLETLRLLSVGLGVELRELHPIENPANESLQLKWLLLMHGI